MEQHGCVAPMLRDEALSPARRETWRRLKPCVPYLLAAVLLLQITWTWGHLARHVADYWDGAGGDLREDFVAFYAAADLVRSDRGWALYRPEIVASVEKTILGRAAGHENGLVYMNPPFVAGMIEPFTGLSYGRAQALWCAISVLLIAASLALLWPELRAMGAGRARLFTLAVVASMPVHASLVYGQLSPFVLFSWSLFYRFVSRGQDKAAGLALAGALVKPQLAFVPLIYLVFTRRWHALGSFAAAGACLAGVSVMLTGFDTTFVDYPRMLARSLSWQREFGIDRVNMFGWNGFLNHVVPNDQHLLTLGITAALGLVTLAIAALAWRRQEDIASSPAPMLAIAAATILASPHIHKQDLQVLIVPAALVAAYRRDLFGAMVPALLLLLLPRSTLGPNMAPFLLSAVLTWVVLVYSGYPLPVSGTTARVVTFLGVRPAPDDPNLGQATTDERLIGTSAANGRG